MSAETANRIAVRPLDDSTFPAAMAFVASVIGRTESRDFQRWRYRDCPTMEGSVAMVGDECVATMFALRRTYLTADGPREWLEPFEWHSNEDWRAQAPGLRILRHYMKASRPLIAVPGTDAAAGLLERVRWKRLGTAERYALPLSGRYFESRGRGALFNRVFDLVGRRIFTPSTRRNRRLILEPASTYASAVAPLAARQTRFTLMREPDDTAARWLQNAPAPVGAYGVLHARVDGRLAGWVLTRVFVRDRTRVGELLEVFLDEEFRDLYPDLIGAASATLTGFRPDVLLATTTCPDTAAALRALRFRLDVQRPVLAWGGDAPEPDGTVLVDGAIGDHAFFPLPTDADAAWLEASAP